MTPLRVFIGYDRRQPLAYTVCRSSVERRARGRVQVEPLNIEHLPITRRGLTDFTFARYLVPWLCDYRGRALYMDGDMIARSDVWELLDIADPRMAVSVVQGPLRFEWASLMVYQCDSATCSDLTPGYVNDETTQPSNFSWTDRLGSLPREWNHLVGYDPPNPGAKVIHYTAGVPCWPETEHCEYADLWREELRYATSTVSWEALMGKSVHRAVIERFAPRG